MKFSKSGCYLHKKEAILKAFLLCLMVHTAFAQNYGVKRYADDNGLPSRIVRSVIQDKNDFIWVGGNNGLYRFDGREFVPYLAALKDTIGLRDNKITALLESVDGKLWVGTPKGLHVLENNAITHIALKENPSDYEQYVTDIFQDREQNIWISTYAGMYQIGPSQKPIRVMPQNSREVGYTSPTFWSVTEDHNGAVWAAANDGLFIRTNGTHFLFEKVPLRLSHALKTEDITYYRVQHYGDNLYLIDSNIGLLKGERAPDLFTISSFLNEKGEDEIGYAVERSLIDNEGNIWLATWKQSFKKFKLINGQLVNMAISSKNGFFELSDIVHSVYQDTQGHIWFSNANGLHKFSIDTSPISVFPPYDCLLDFKGIYALVLDKADNLWATTPTQLYRFKKQDLLQGNCPDDYLVFDEKYMQQARNLFIDNENRLWIGADGGLFVTQLDEHYKPSGFKRYTTKDGLPHNRCHEIHQIEKNKFWVGNYNGLVQLQLKDGDLMRPSFKVYAADADAKDRLVNSQAMHFEHDEKGNLWVGTFSGTSQLLDTAGQGKFKNYTSVYGNSTGLSNNAIKKILRDSEERLWIATQRGLNLYVPENDNFLQFGHAEGLPSEYVTGIQEDSKGFLWICTTNGVLKAKYDPSAHGFVQATHYTASDGLRDNIPYRNSIMIDEADNVFIGSRDGISMVNGYDFKKWHMSNRQKIVVTDMQHIKKDGPGFSSILDEVRGGHITLAHNANSLKLKYALLDFTTPENNTYRHKFLPVSDSWIETGTNAELTFFNLAPGRYDLILDGSHSTGSWSENPVRLQLTVEAPFWKSRWAYLAYAILFLFAVWGISAWQTWQNKKRLHRKMQLETALMNEREEMRKENAADFHDELGSMVTKISMFLTMAERNYKEGRDPSNFFKKMRANVKGLSTGFRDLLWVIDPQKDSLADTFLRLKEFGEDFFEEKGIDFKTSEFKDGFSQKILDPKTKKQVMMIFKEAMINAAKYSRATEAELFVKTSKKYTNIHFKDNGAGFDVNQEQKGRGLRNMKSRAKKLDADFTLVSSNDGTTIKLHRIPHLEDIKLKSHE